MQIVAKGAQDQLVNGNPSFTHFRSVYKRHTDFAMEHFRLNFRSTNLSIPPSGNLTLRAKVDRNAQLLHDCYLNLTLPAIFSPIVPLTLQQILQSPVQPPPINSSSQAIGYEFQWIPNIGYNMINYVAILINGQEIVRHTGEWMKLYAALTYNANKKAILNELVGNVPELYDPANTSDRTNQYPHAISPSLTKNAEPSIQGRVLTIPFHFWFCEDVGTALPLIALQHSEVEFVVELKSMYSLFTTLDVNPASSTFGTRIAPDSSNPLYSITHFLSPPSFLNPTIPINSTLTLWNTNAFIEANFIFLNDAELSHIAKSDHSFKITQIDVKSVFGQYGASNDLELGLRNLCTRVVWVAQRSDRASQNDVDNYTNWVNPNKFPSSSFGSFMTSVFSSGSAITSSVSQRDILLESTIILDGKERFGNKQTQFFSQIQNYQHNQGRTIIDLPGVYSYSFSLDNSQIQPSGHINGSMFNRTILRNTYVQPPLALVLQGTTNTVCVLKETALSTNPTTANRNTLGSDGKLLHSPNELVTIIRKSDAPTLQYSYNVRAYVESYNFLRVLGGVANVVFSS